MNLDHRRPNVIILVADDHESRAMGWAGNPTVQTPHLDRLAETGIAFSRAYHMGGCDDAVCIPTRASLLTGMDFHHAMRGGHGVIDPDHVTLPEHFKNSGYYSYVIGKWHNDLASLTRSFDDGATIFTGGMDDHFATPVRPFDATGAYPDKDAQIHASFVTDLFCDNAADFIQSYEREEPFFLYTAFTAPHDPRTPPPEFAALYDTATIPLPENFASEHEFDFGVSDIRDERLAPYPRTPKRVREELAAYYGMISAMDAGIGRILQAVEASGQLENTIIVYTGDHGLAVGQHGLMGKQNVYEHSVRVPLIFSGPGMTGNQISNALTYSWDSFPTLCDLCDLAIPEGLDASKLTDVITGTRSNHRESITTIYQNCQRMITEDQWKLIVTLKTTAAATDNPLQYQLFNVLTDPNETVNLATDPSYSIHLQRLLGLLTASTAGLPVPAS